MFPRPTRAEIREMLRLASPIVLAQVGIMLMGVVDTAMVGRVGPSTIAAVALGHIYWMMLIVPGMGLLHVLDPVVAQAVGARDTAGVARGVQRGIILALALSVPTALLLVPGEFFFGMLRQPADVIPIASVFTRWGILGVPATYLFVVWRQTLQAMARVRAVVASIIVANAVNAFLNWVLIYGHLGFQPHGAVGSAWSTIVSRWMMFLMVAWFGRHELAAAVRPWRRESWSIAPMARMLAIGAPVAVLQWVELAFFAGGALAIGLFGAVPLAAHEIALNLAALTFMVPMGIAAAAAAMVGRAIGRGDVAAARRDAVAAIAVGLAFMTVAAAVFTLAPNALAGVFVKDEATRGIAASLIAIAGLFQVFDGIQGVAQGVLRGAADTRVPMIIHLLGFWAFGAPLALFLTFPAGMGPRGIWWGFVGALAIVATAQLLRVRWKLAGDLRRVLIDATPVTGST